MKKEERDKVWFLQNKKEKKDIRLATGKGEGTDWAFSEHDIMNVVSLDIDNVYVTCRGAVWKQNQGCPIGGFLSAMYANIKCMYDEKTFIHNLGTQARRIYAIRQVDDLIMWIAYNREDSKTRMWAEEKKEEIIKGTLYKGGLILEEQEVDLSVQGEQRRKFCGTWVVRKDEENEMWVIPRNVNEESLIQEGRQKIPRYVSAQAWTNSTYKKGMIIGNLHRIESQTTRDEDLLWAVKVGLLEMRVCGYTGAQLAKAVWKMATRYERWKKVLCAFERYEREIRMKGRKAKGGDGRYTEKRKEKGKGKREGKHETGDKQKRRGKREGRERKERRKEGME